MRPHVPPSFEAIVGMYQNKVFRLVYSILGDASRSEEVTQETFLKVWQALDNYDGRAALGTWIYTIARNSALNQLRAESYRRAASLEDVEEPAARPSDSAETSDIRRMVEQLPEEQREAIVLFYLQERSVEEVSQMLDIPAGTVKSHLHRARKALAAMLEVKPRKAEVR